LKTLAFNKHNKRAHSTLNGRMGGFEALMLRLIVEGFKSSTHPLILGVQAQVCLYSFWREISAKTNKNGGKEGRDI
jgi:hypothetical protein